MLDRRRRDPRPRRVREPGDRGDDRRRRIRPARTASPFSGSASGCRWPSSSSRGTSAASHGRTAPNSTSSRPHPVIDLMTEWFDERTRSTQRRDASSEKGATMRLGAYPCRLSPGSLAQPGLPAGGHLRAAPAPIRVQQRLPEALRGKGSGFQRDVPDGGSRGDRRVARPPLVSRVSVPPRVQVQAHGGPPALPRVHPGGTHLQPVAQASVSVRFPGLRVTSPPSSATPFRQRPRSTRSCGPAGACRRRRPPARW